MPVLDEMTLGRAGGCAIVINDTFASQLHARVFRRDGVVFIEDLGSTNGTFLNRKPVHGPETVQVRDRIQIGNVVLELAPMMQLRSGAVTGPGRVRQVNQDRYLVFGQPAVRRRRRHGRAPGR